MAKNDPRSGNCLPRSVGLIQGFSSLRPEEQKVFVKIIPKDEEGGASDSKLGAQSKKLHEILDALQELTNKEGPPKLEVRSGEELGELATLNEYPTQKLRVSSTLLQLCADGILFGATTPCEVCKESGRSGRILLDGEVYRCTGWLTEHLRCSFQTQEPERQVWQLTPRAKQLQKLAKMKLKVGQRLFSTKISEDAPAPSQPRGPNSSGFVLRPRCLCGARAVGPSGDGIIPLSGRSSSTVQCKPPLLNLSVYLSKGFSKEKREELADMVKGHMGSIATSLAKGVCFVVSSEELMKKETKEVEAGALETWRPGLDPKAPSHPASLMSYYTKIDGVNLDRALKKTARRQPSGQSSGGQTHMDAAIIEACEAAVKGKGDGRVSVEDAQEVFKFVKDAGKVTETELWTMRYCLTEYNFTEAASDWITNAVKGITKYADKVAKGKKISGYYEKVDGVQCDHEVLEVCRKAVAGAGDGRVSKEDAKLVLAAVTDGGKVTQTEKWTLRLCLSEFNWTEAAQDWFAEELKAFTSAKKRPSSAPGRPAKKVKTVDNGKKVKSVLGSLKVLEKSEKADVLSMVSSMGQKTLAVPKEERHSFQSDAFKMVEKLLNDAHVVLQNQLAAAKELIDNSDAEKAKREAAVKAAEEALTASKAGKEKAMEKNQEKSTALKAAEDALKSAQTQQKDGDAKAVSLEKEKAALEEGTKDWMGELRKAEKGWTGEGWQLAMTRLHAAWLDCGLARECAGQPRACKKCASKGGLAKKLKDFTVVYAGVPCWLPRPWGGQGADVAGVQAKPLNHLTKALNKASIDSSLVQSIPFALKKKPESRVGFDLVIVEKLDDAIKDGRRNTLADLTTNIEKEGPERQARLAAVEAATSAAEAAKAAAAAAAEALKAAKDGLSAATATLGSAKKSYGSFDAEPWAVDAAKTELVPGVDEFFLYKLEAGTVTNMAPNLLWGEARKQFKRIEETGTQKFVEKDGVNMDSDIGELLERTHVLVERAKQRVYSEMLSLTDMVSGSNSFYTFCVLESDKDSGGSCYWVWRKWGRIGLDCGTKLEEFKSSKQAAIAQFSKLYLEKTGNTYGHKPSEFTQKPGKFSRVDIQHKALQNKKAKTEQEEDDFEDGDAQGGQPLGQLSKAAVEKGNGVLDQIENLLNDIGEGGTPSPVQKGKIAAHSAEFYSLIPHNFGMKAPPPINTQDALVFVPVPVDVVLGVDAFRTPKTLQ
eukprot:g29283.t1